ncbi:carboxyltransferase domain-containing protein [Brachybacterium sp. AOP42-E1-35]|uniref:carboxyltransferase domain-containing protein n=1 Tax=Brachybacterium sp. AOP42-E1-35 TaxID=3457664 RepID=UPI00402AE784
MTTNAECLDPPLATHRTGESALLAEYPDTAAVLAAAAAVELLAPPHLVDLVPAERTLLLVGTAARDVAALTALLDELPVPDALEETAAEVQLGIVYDGEDLDEVAALLGMSSQALVAAHSATRWTAAFGGFAPGFAYLVPDLEGPSEGGIRWEVPRLAEPRTAVPAGSVGLASRYCGVYPRPSPGGWQLIGRSDASLFDEHRDPPALLVPSTRVRFLPQRATARSSTTALSRPAQEGAGPRRRGRRHAATPTPSTRTVLEVVSPGPQTLLQDAGRPGLATIGVSASGSFDQGARIRANITVGNPARAAVLETLIGPLVLRAEAPTVVAITGASAPWEVRRADDPGHPPMASTITAGEQPIALDPGDLLTVGPATDGLRLVVAVRGGIRADGGEVLGSMSRDTLSGLGPAPLTAGDRVRVGEEHGLDAVPSTVPLAEDPGPASALQAPRSSAAGGDDGADSTPVLEVPVHPGPRDGLLGPSALSQLLTTTWTVRTDSDRVGVRLEGPGLPVPPGSGSLPSEPMVPGAIQVPPSGLPVVFGPDHPTTGGYPVIAVVTRAGLDRLAQAAPGARVRLLAVR